MLIEPAADYRSERVRVLGLLEAAGGVLEHHEHPVAGPDGKPVTLDVGRLGAPPGDARAVVVVASGTHGVEGHTGSAIQELLLDSGDLRGLAPGVAVLVVHAVNPYGMAWERRVDHDNIDVNRNFVRFAAPLPANPHYDDIAEVINPVILDFDDTDWIREVSLFIEKVGVTEGFHALTGGQYHNPAGMQYGGNASSWSRTALESIWRRHLGGAHCVINLDLHTGLGPRGMLTVFQTADADEPAAQVGAQVFPAVLRSSRTVAGEAVHSGVLGPGLDATVTDGATVTVPLVVEFGTHRDMVVFGAMRADNWLHNHADPRSAAGEHVRAMMRSAFTVDDEEWRSEVTDQARAIVRSALDTASATVS